MAPALLATAQQTARPVWLTVPAIGVRTRTDAEGVDPASTVSVSVDDLSAVQPRRLAAFSDPGSGPASEFSAAIRGAANIHLAANAGFLEIAVENIAGEGVCSRSLYQRQGAPTESASHHSRSVDSVHAGSQFHHYIQLFAAHLVIIAQAAMRSLHQFSERREIGMLQCFRGR